jgi:hypothetical protein
VPAYGANSRREVFWLVEQKMAGFVSTLNGGDSDLHDTDFNVALVAIHIPVNAATGPPSPDETSRQ